MREGLKEQRALLAQQSILIQQLDEIDEEWRNKRKTIIDNIMVLERQRYRDLASAYRLKCEYQDLG